MFDGSSREEGAAVRPDAAGRTVTFEVLRYRPEQEDAPVWQRYEVPYRDDLSVLQALQHIKDEIDGTLSFRWSCRMAICGSCGMMVDGKPMLSCQTFVRDLLPGPIKVEPLAHLPIERDLVVEVDGFVDKLQSVKPWLMPKTPRTLAQGEYRQSPAQLAQIEQFSSCINCMLCYAACPQFGLNPDFAGPGVIALAHRYNADSRDGGRAERFQALNAEEGVWSCTAVGYCSEVCPKHVDPANAVNQNKIQSAKDYFLRFVPGRGGAR
jgi:fumarate reductase iron-sulfur subunit